MWSDKPGPTVSVFLLVSLLHDVENIKGRKCAFASDTVLD